MKPKQIAHIFSSEYERLNNFVYDGSLPPFPGVRVNYNKKKVGTCPVDKIGTFNVSARLMFGTDVIEVARHETAHMAAILIDEDYDHGDAWMKHANLCGAFPSRHIFVNVNRGPLRKP